MYLLFTIFDLRQVVSLGKHDLRKLQRWDCLVKLDIFQALEVTVFPQEAVNLCKMKFPLL